ncbi:hypothetical protein BGZ94_001343 [Podila epigama]|nr:hypothetical protein BGZ94_001343 [Podila epigama]
MHLPDDAMASAPQIPLPEPQPQYRSTAKPKPPLTPQEIENMTKPKVLIVGAGLGGLTLAILLEKAGIPYEVYERAHEVVPLGSAFVFGPSLAPLFQQMGIYEEFKMIGKHDTEVKTYNEDLKLQFELKYGFLEKVAGYREYIVSRPDFYDLLWRHVPRERIHLGKRVLSFMQNKNGIMIRCSDNKTHHGDILVGADGAYSAVRQHLYSLLKKDKKLPLSDDVKLPFSCVCLVGQTKVLDPEEFPDVKAEKCQHYSVLGVDNRCTWLTFTTKRRTVCWMVIEFLTKESLKKHDSFRNSEWGNEAAEAMCRQVRNFKVPGGKDGRVLTLGDYIDLSPKEYISKVMLEEKVFETWYHDRTVLLGDGASGALTAMHDAVTLANWISTLESPTVDDMKRVFNDYYTERYSVVKDAFETSQVFTKTLGKKNNEETACMAVETNFYKAVHSSTSSIVSASY